mgnify:FL=1
MSMIPLLLVAWPRALSLAALFILSASVVAGPYDEMRYITRPIVRDASSSKIQPALNPEAEMTKKVRIENADTSEYKVVVQVWDKSFMEGQPDTLIKEIPLNYPTAMTGEDVYLTSSRYLVVKEV